MEVFRIAREAYSKNLQASGRSARWNIDDQFVIYTGSSRSLSSLELVVHQNAVSPAFKYKVMVISVADEDNLYTQVMQADLPKSWRGLDAYPDTQLLGGSWYQQKSSLILKVPSAIIPKEYNYL